MSAKRLKNILLMGETGNGKSTLINSFQNYSTYKSFFEAMHRPQLCVIPTKFTIRDENFEDIAITAGKSDPNECREDGMSATIAPQSYRFSQFEVRLIDTSGFAATQGMQQDADSVRDILNYISQYDALDAIAIVVKGNNSRLTAQFEYSILQVLTILSKKAVDNIIFVFTHCDKPGDTVVTLKEVFKRMKKSSGVDLHINKNNAFSFENEAFRSLMVAKSGIQLTAREIKQNEIQWSSAYESCQRLLSYVSTLTPHDVAYTLSIRDARLFAEDISSVAAQLLINIESKKADLIQKRAEIEMANDNIKKMDVDSLKSMRIEDITFVEAERPITVCNECCVESYRLADGREVTYYPRVCCEGCEKWNWTPLYFCKAFSLDASCKICKCGLSQHVEKHFKTVKDQVEVVNAVIASDLEEAKSDKERKEIAVKALCLYLEKLEEETVVILDAIGKLVSFIENNAIVNSSNASEAYSNQYKKTMSRDQKTAKQLKSALDVHMTRSEPLADVVDIEDIEYIKKCLLKLEINGPKISSLCRLTEQSRRRVNREIVVN